MNWRTACLSLALALSAAPGARAADAAASPRSAYLGWRLFQANCARCHGPEATGSAGAPDLTARVRGMSEQRFVETVLRRYQWVLPSSEAATEGGAREALIQDVLRRALAPARGRGADAGMAGRAGGGGAHRRPLRLPRRPRRGHARPETSTR